MIGFVGPTMIQRFTSYPVQSEMRTSWGKPILLALVAATLSGCVTYPVAKDLQQQARRVTLAQVREDPGAYQGTIVIWGGRIINITNDVNSSAMYVLCLPLDNGGRPVREAGSPGRFIASSKDFLDPEIYQSGRLVTIAGSIAGLESQPIQNSRYNYPVLDVKQIHLWPNEPRSYYYDYDYGPDWGWYYPYPAWGWGWWYPGWSIGWYYRGGWDWDRRYHYHDGSYHYRSGQSGGSYHYQGGGGGGTGGRSGGGTGHWHR